MENKAHITAEWAKKTATAILGEKVQKELGICLLSIENAVKRNEMSTYVGISADTLTIKELEKRGFVVKQHFDQRDGSDLYIKW